MNKRVDMIIEEARKLSPEEREELMQRLQGIGHSDRQHTRRSAVAPEVSGAAHERAAQVDRGEVTLVPWHEVLDELRK